MEVVSSAAWWSALAQAYHHIYSLVPSSGLNSSIPFVAAQSSCHTFFDSHNVPLISKPIPPRAKDFWSRFQTSTPPKFSQRKIMSSINSYRHRSLLSDFKSPSSDYSRLISLSSKSSGLWLTTSPTTPTLSIPDSNFSISSRLRLGLVPFDDLHLCTCGASLSTHPLHFLSCILHRPLTTVRHDRLLQLLCRIARTCGIAVQVEPSVGDGKDRTDGVFFFSSHSSDVDVSVVHPSAPSHIRRAVTALGTASFKEKEKLDLYFLKAQQDGRRFYPFVLESFGAIGKNAREFIAVLQDEAAAHGVRALYGYKFTDYVLRSISVTLQLGNSYLLTTAAKQARVKRRKL
jgi:hypothetical protein